VATQNTYKVNINNADVREQVVAPFAEKVPLGHPD
jgi:hypothetical protein